MNNELEQFYINPSTPAQRQYEAVRAFIVDKLSAEEVAKKFNYSIKTIYSFIRDAKAGKLNLFPVEKRCGPKARRTPLFVQKAIIRYRKQNLSCKDIVRKIQSEGYKISMRTVEYILTDANFSRLPRRTDALRGMTNQKQQMPQRAQPLDFEKLAPFSLDCPVAGVFFFLPYVLESGILSIVKQCQLPESSAITAEQACLSMLLLKLVGNKRLSHMDAYDHEPGLGLFAALSMLPKSSYMSSYSCRTSEAQLMDFQQQLMEQFRTTYPAFYQSEFINLDFHSIPHFGTESQMEKVWCGARGKALKGANTLFAQDSVSNNLIYARADILHKDEGTEVQQFAAYWRKIKGAVNETLVFDCKLTTYKVLDELAEDNVKFITLRKRHAKLLAETALIEDENWKKIKLPIPKRMHKNCLPIRLRYNDGYVIVNLL